MGYIKIILATGVAALMFIGYQSYRSANGDETLTPPPRGVAVQTPALRSQPNESAVINQKEGPLVADRSVSDKEDKAKRQRNLLLEAYKNIDNGRSFVLENWSRPEIGGQFYASIVADQCAFIDDDILARAQSIAKADGGDDHLKAIAAATMFRKRCAQFTADEYRQYSKTALNRDENGVRDRLVLATSEFTNAPAGSDARRNATQKLLDIADPLVLDQLGARLSSYTADNKGYVYFSDQSYPLAQANEILSAYYLMPCGLGLQCDASDPNLAVECVLTGKCYDSRFDKVQREYADHDPGAYQQILTLYQAMVSAINARNVNAFIAR